MVIASSFVNDLITFCANVFLASVQFVKNNEIGTVKVRANQ